MGDGAVAAAGRFVAVAALISVLAGFAWAGGPNYGEPIDLPNNEFAADPSVIRVGDRYYLYPTTTGVSVECWSSTDLENWTYEGVVWGPAEPGSWNDGGVWAPDVFQYEGKFYLYYTANMKIGVAVADEPTGPFVDVYDHPFIGGGYGNTAGKSIDAHVFQDDDGSLYIYCTTYIPVSAIRVSRMIDPVTVVGDWQLVVVPNLLSWELHICEGPWMVKHGGIYYLMYSGNGANLPLYAIGYATATNPMGPFEKYEGNPILHVDWEHEFYGPGHNSVVTDDQGTMWMFYHTKVEPTIGWERVVRKNKLAFDTEGNMYVVLDDDDDVSDDDVSDDDTDDDTSADDDSGEDEGCGC